MMMKKIKGAILTILCLGILIVPQTSSAATIEELTTLLNSLLRQVQVLQQQLTEQTTQPEAPAETTPTISYNLTKNLSQGDSGPDVLNLQKVLNMSADTQVATTGAGSPGNETDYFGALTKAAVVKFQDKYASEILAPVGLTSGTGYVGSSTRAKVSVIQVSESLSSPVPTRESSSVRTKTWSADFITSGWTFKDNYKDVNNDGFGNKYVLHLNTYPKTASAISPSFSDFTENMEHTLTFKMRGGVDNVGCSRAEVTAEIYDKAGALIFQSEKLRPAACDFEETSFSFTGIPAQIKFVGSFAGVQNRQWNGHLFIDDVLISNKSNCEPNCSNKQCDDDGCGGTCGECGVGSECDAGVCVAIPQTCSDSDGGKDYYKKGTTSVLISVAAESKTDSCALCTGDCSPDAISCNVACGAVVEYYCAGDAIQSETYICPNGCEEGICMGGVDCPADIKVCPDGSTVSRVPPDCEFAVCPNDCRDENHECTTEDIPCCDGLKEVGDCFEKDHQCICADCGSICRPCGNGVCDENENKCNCPEDCEIQKQTCAQLGGTICLVNETCSGSWLSASDSERCCGGTCEIVIEDIYYVSPDGNDNNPGTLTNPFKTIEKARDVVRTINSNMDEDIIVYLRGGTYELEDTIVFTQEDSGMNGYNVVYSAFGREIPIISGGKKVTGWTLYDSQKNIWKAKSPVGDSRQLYVNGERAVRAMADGGILTNIQVTDAYDGYITNYVDIKNWNNLNDIEFVDKRSWRNYRCQIKSVEDYSSLQKDSSSQVKIILKDSCWKAATKTIAEGLEYLQMGAPILIENAYELLNEPGEWYLNKNDGWLYYIPKSNENIATSDIIIPKLEILIEGNGNTFTAPVQNIVFNGLRFSYATWLGPNSDYGFVEAYANHQYHLDQNNGPILSNVFFTGSRNIEFRNNVFSHLGGMGLGMRNTAKNNIIIGNRFYDISGTGLYVGDYDKNRAQTVYDAQINENNIISNNYVHDVSNEYFGGVGILQGMVRNSEISHNEIYDLPYTAIHNGGGWGLWDPSISENNQISNNYIHEVMKSMDDGGGIYLQGAQSGTKITGNYITGLENEPGAIYLDEGSGFIEVENNVLFDNQRTIMIKGGEHVFQNNYWQDRGLIPYKGWGFLAPDIRIFDIPDEKEPNYISELPCEDTCIFENNHVITSLGDLDNTGQQIVNNAGIEAEYQYIKESKTSTFPTKILYGDFNGDGAEDKLISYKSLLKWDVILGGEYESAVWLENWGTGLYQVTLDLNGDGLDDFVLIYKDLSNVWRWHVGISDGAKFIKYTNALLGQDTGNGVCVSDYDKDGSEEIIISGTNSNKCVDFNSATNKFTIKDCSVGCSLSLALSTNTTQNTSTNQMASVLESARTLLNQMKNYLGNL